MQRESFFKHAAVYGLANFLLQAGGFVLLPIYLHCLDPADYGVLDVVGRLAETVGACLLFGGFRQALLTFHQQVEDEPQRRRLVCSALMLYLISALVGGGVALAVLPNLCDWAALNLTDTPAVAASPVMGVGLFRLALIGILLEPFSLVPLTLIQARVESAVYVMIVVGQLLMRVTLSLVLVRCLSWGVSGALTATACTGLVFGLILSAREFLRGPAWPSSVHMIGLLRFALPLMPGGLCFFVLHHCDRFFLNRYAPAAEVGIYALGYKLAMTASTFSLAPLYMVWSARMYAVACSPDAPLVFGRMFTRILAAYALVGLGLCLFATEAIGVLGGDIRYARASTIIAPVLLACLLQGAVSLMDAGLYVRHRPGLKLGITLTATVVMLVLYSVLIPRYGSMGAALATLGGFAFLALLTWVVTQRVFPVRYEWLRLIFMVALGICLWLPVLWLPRSPWMLPVKLVLWLLAPLLVWLFGMVTPEEKDDARGLVRLLRRRLQKSSWPVRRRIPPAKKLGPTRPSDDGRSDLSLTAARGSD